AIAPPMLLSSRSPPPSTSPQPRPGPCVVSTPAERQPPHREHPAPQRAPCRSTEIVAPAEGQWPAPAPVCPSRTGWSSQSSSAVRSDSPPALAAYPGADSFPPHVPRLPDPATPWTYPAP